MKPLFTFICIVLVFTMLAIPTAAYSEVDGETTVTVDTEAVESTDISANDEQTAEENIDENENTNEEAVEENIFELIYLEIGKYTSEIFCAASLIGTVILSFFYKKGLFPMLKAGITALSGTVNGIKENNEKCSNELLLGKNDLISGLKKTDEILGTLSEKINALEVDLNAISNIEKREAAFEVILRTQVEALSDIFMSSSLPEYQKAALGERIAAMKEALKNVGQAGEN